jgi:transketolase
VVRSSEGDRVTLVAAGITLHEALAAAEELAGDGIAARVIDLYSIKPIDSRTLRQAARETGQIVTIEDHWPEGGLGDAVLEVFGPMGSDHPRVTKLAVHAMPGSATPAQQLAEAGIDARGIVQAVRELVGAPAGASA